MKAKSFLESILCIQTTIMSTGKPETLKDANTNGAYILMRLYKRKVD